MVALLATGGSTNHLIHWVAVARAAGIRIDWTDFSELSRVTPLLARVYPNGAADVNQFQAAGGPGFVIRELLESGGMHADVATVVDGRPGRLRAGSRATPAARCAGATCRPRAATRACCAAPAQPFSEEGGLKLLRATCGRAVIKVSSVPRRPPRRSRRRRVVFDSQEAMLRAFAAGELERDFVAVVRFQGPRANGMPELHKLTPPLGALQKKGFRVALRHRRPHERRVGQGAGCHPRQPRGAGRRAARLACAAATSIRLDAAAGTLEALVEPPSGRARELPRLSDEQADENGHGLGRELFAGMRSNVGSRRRGGVHMAVTHAGELEPLDLASPWTGDPGHRHRARRATRCRWRGRCSTAASGCSRSRCARRPRWPRSRRSRARVPEAIVGAGTVRSGGRCAARPRRRCAFRA